MFCTGKKDGDEFIAILTHVLVVDAGHVSDRYLSCSLDEGIEFLLKQCRIGSKERDRVCLCLKLISMNCNNLIKYNNININYKYS